MQLLINEVIPINKQYKSDFQCVVMSNYTYNQRVNSLNLSHTWGISSGKVVSCLSRLNYMLKQYSQTKLLLKVVHYYRTHLHCSSSGIKTSTGLSESNNATSIIVVIISPVLSVWLNTSGLCQNMYSIIFDIMSPLMYALLNVHLWIVNRLLSYCNRMTLVIFSSLNPPVSCSSVSNSIASYPSQ